MPTLDELRRWARGEPIQSLPERPSFDLSKTERGQRLASERLKLTGYANQDRPTHKISTDGTDALLKFGEYRGRTVSALVAKDDGRRFLRWVLRKDFPEELKDVIRYQLTAARHAAPVLSEPPEDDEPGWTLVEKDDT